MFASMKNVFQRNKFIKLMSFLAGATAQAPGFAYVPEKDADLLAQHEPTFVTVNKTMKDANGNVSVSATTAGIAAVKANESAPVTTAAPAEPQQFEILSGIQLPVSKRGGIRNETYPFDKLAVGQSFFVPATTERPNPAKSLASTVSSATRRYKGKDGRHFTIRSYEHNGVKGALIYRLENKPVQAAPVAPTAPVAQ